MATGGGDGGGEVLRRRPWPMPPGVRTAGGGGAEDGRQRERGWSCGITSQEDHEVKTDEEREVKTSQEDHQVQTDEEREDGAAGATAESMPGATRAADEDRDKQNADLAGTRRTQGEERVGGTASAGARVTGEDCDGRSADLADTLWAQGGEDAGDADSTGAADGDVDAEHVEDGESAGSATPSSHAGQGASWALYQLLGVSKYATVEEIKRAYRGMGLRWHPDKRAGDPQATKIFQQIVEAYNTLKDPQSRMVYDLTEWNREIGSSDIDEGAAEDIGEGEATEHVEVSSKAEASEEGPEEGEERATVADGPAGAWPYGGEAEERWLHAPPTPVRRPPAGRAGYWQSYDVWQDSDGDDMASPVRREVWIDSGPLVFVCSEAEADGGGDHGPSPPSDLDTLDGSEAEMVDDMGNAQQRVGASVEGAWSAHVQGKGSGAAAAGRPPVEAHAQRKGPPNADGEVQFFVRLPSGKQVTVRLNPDTTLSEVLDHATGCSGAVARGWRAVYGGRCLRAAASLTANQITADVTVHAVLRLDGGGRSKESGSRTGKGRPMTRGAMPRPGHPEGRRAMPPRRGEAGVPDRRRSQGRTEEDARGATKKRRGRSRSRGTRATWTAGSGLGGGQHAGRSNTPVPGRSKWKKRGRGRGRRERSEPRGVTKRRLRTPSRSPRRGAEYVGRSTSRTAAGQARLPFRRSSGERNSEAVGS